MRTHSARLRLLATTAFLGAAALPLAAHAADAAATAAPAGSEVGELVVTGSHIRTDNFTSPVPLAVVSGDQVRSSGKVILGDILLDLPQIDSNTNNQNSSSTLFLAGQARADIRGLGASRTLVLVDGRRHVNSDASSPAVDLNMIPTLMIDRVDVVTGAASAIYGSDAISGVVNLIMKKKYDGVLLDAQTGISQRGDGEQYRVSVLAGHSFLNDRFHILAGAEIAREEPIMQVDRSWAYPGIRRNTLVSPQTIIPASRSTTTPFGTLELKAGAAGTAIAVTEDMRNRQNITLLPPECSPTTVLPTCQDPSLFYTAALNALQGDVKRGAGRVYADYEVTHDIKVFSEFTFARTHGYGIFQPAFSTTTGAGTLPANIFGDNAFLNGPGANAAALRAFWTGAGLSLTQASKAGFGKFWTEFGGRNVESDRDSYRYVGGAEGDFAFHRIHWEAYGEYGEVRGTTISFGVPNIQKTLNALDAVNSGGTIKCRINADANPNNDDAACAPWDFLNGPSTAAVAYANAQSRTVSNVKETVLSANVTGDVIQLPAGPLGAAFGLEYRHEASSFAQDALGASGALFLNIIGTRAGHFDVREAYGEFNVPLVKDQDFTKELSVNVAGRVSNYSTVGDTKTWRLAGVWAPIDDIKFRAELGTAVRAPNIVELFAPQSVNFISTANDPCDKSVFAGATAAQQAARTANCGAAISGYNPATFISNFGTGRPSLQLLQGGNPNLRAEEARTKQLGFVFTPRFIPRLSFSFDYFDYRVRNYISTTPVQTALNLCYDSVTPYASNPFCAAVVRDPTGAATGTAGGVSTVKLINQNVAFVHVTGYDMSLGYSFRLNEVMRTDQDLGSVALRIDATRMYNWFFQGSPLDAPFNFAGYVTNSTPDYKANGTLQYQVGKLQVSWQTHWIHSMSSTNSFNPSQLSPFYTGDYWTHDLRGAWRFNDRYEVRGGILNLTDRTPPLLPETFTGTGTAANYDNRGRFFYVGASASF